MRAVAQPLERVRLHRAEAAHPHAGLDHPLDQLVLELHPADRVDQHVALDARARALAQRVGDVVRDLAAPVDVREQADALLAPRGSCAGSSGKIWSPLISSSTSLPHETGAPVSASAARRNPPVADVELAAQVVAVAALAAVAQRVGAVPAPGPPRPPRRARRSALRGARDAGDDGGRPIDHRRGARRRAGRARAPSGRARTRARPSAAGAAPACRAAGRRPSRPAAAAGRG